MARSASQVQTFVYYDKELQSARHASHLAPSLEIWRQCDRAGQTTVSTIYPTGWTNASTRSKGRSRTRAWRCEPPRTACGQKSKSCAASSKSRARNFGGRSGGVEARLHTQSSEHYVKTEKEFERVRNEFERVHEGLQQLNIAILDLHRTMTRIAWSAAIAVVAAVIGVLLANL